MDARMGTEEALVGLPSKGVNQVYTKKADQSPNAPIADNLAPLPKIFLHL